MSNWNKRKRLARKRARLTPAEVDFLYARTLMRELEKRGSAPLSDTLDLDLLRYFRGVAKKLGHRC